VGQSARKIMLWCWIIAASVVFFVKGFYPGFTKLESDFQNYYLSAKLLVQGESVAQFYDNDWFEQEAKSSGIEMARFTPFPPLTAFLMVPFVGFEVQTAKQIWLLVNLLLLALVAWLLKDLGKLSWLESWALIAFVTMPLAGNSRFGQFYVLLTLCMLGSYWLLIKNHFKSSGAVLAFIVSIKYVPVILLAGFSRISSLAILAWFTGFMLLFFGIQWFGLGGETTIAWFEILVSHLSGNIPGQGQHPYAFQSLESLLSNLFVYDPIANPLPWIDHPNLKSVLKYVFSFSVLAAAIYIGYQFKLVSKELRAVSTLLLSTLVFLVLIPASATYHFVMALFPAMIWWRYFKDFSASWIKLLLPLIFLASVSVSWSWFAFDTGLRWLDVLIRYPRFWGVFACFILVLISLKQNLHKMNLSHG
jgi:hypothetical protein